MDYYESIINDYKVALESYDDYSMSLCADIALEAETDNVKDSNGPNVDRGSKIETPPLEKDITINPTENMKSGEKELNNLTPNKKSSVSIQSIKSKLDMLLKKIWGIIVRLSNQLLDIIKRAMVTNKKFDMLYRSYKNKYKPASSIRVIAYPYTQIELLTKINNGFITAIQNMCNDYKTLMTTNKELENSLLMLDKESLQKEIMKILSAPPNIGSIEENYVVLKNKIRGKKTEIIVKSGDIPKYERAFYGTMKYTEEANKRLKGCKNNIYNIKQSNSAVGAATNKSISDLYSKGTRYLSNINLMYSAYVSYCKTEFILRSEYSFTGRVMLKRMYRMP